MKKKLILFFVVIIMTVCSIPAVINAYANNTNVGEETQEVVTAQAFASSTLPAPSLQQNNTEFNMVVGYNWVAGAGGTELALGRSEYGITDLGIMQWQEYAMPYNSANSKECVPLYLYGKTHSSITSEYSEVTTTEREEKIGGVTYVRYGLECKYVPVGRFLHEQFTTHYMPTSFDQDKYIWNHGAGNNDTIKATIGYNGIYKDIEINIPWIGTTKKAVTINGITFELRTGPNKCSIRTTSNIVYAAGVHFLFGIE